MSPVCSFPLAINLLTSFYDTHAPLVSESGVALRFRLAVASLILIYFTPAVSERLGTLIGFGFVRRGILLESLVSVFILLCPTLCLDVIFPLLLDVARRRSLVAPLDRGLAEIDTAAVRIGYVSKQEGTWILDSWGIIPMLRTFSRAQSHQRKFTLEGGSMKFLRATTIAIAFAAISIGFGYTQFVARATDNAQQAPAFCAKCGDGQCQKSCGENAQTCPRDCGGVPQTSYR